MERPSIRSYQLRDARMTKAQRQAIEEHGQRLIIDPSLKDLAEKSQRLRPSDIFPEKDEVVVEIGSGMGEASAQIAKMFPEKGFIAIEVHRPGIGSLILRSIESEVENIRMINEDCHLVLDLIEDRSVDTFHIFFPDPWPKTKHRKRRLINEDFASLLVTKMRKGGQLRVATDWMDYADQIKKVLDSHTEIEGGIVERPTWRPLTKFESQGINKDHRVTDFLYTRT
jgi:tRNA (guanine-N7-)-methyltransferase